jgi:sulfatase-like protein
MMRALARLVVASFCWATSVYAFLASSSFAYQQFLRPRVFRSIGLFSDHHASAYWIWLAVAIASIVEHLRRAGAPRRLAVAFVAVWSGVGVALAVHPILPALADNPRSIVVGLIALVPIVWIAAIDHAAAWPYFETQSRPPAAEGTSRIEARLFLGALGAAVFSLAVYAALTPVWIADAFEPDLLTRGLVVGLAWNAVDHFVVFLAAFLAMALVERGLARFTSFGVRWAGVLVLASAALAYLIRNVFGTAIGLDGAWGAAVAVGAAVSIASLWSGVRAATCRRRLASLASPFDLWFGTPIESGRWLPTVGSLALAAVTAYGLAALSNRADWDFLILTFGVVGVWMAAFASLYRAAASVASVGTGMLALVCLLPLAGRAAATPVERALPRWLHDQGFDVRHTLDRYLVYNPSFRVADAIFRDPSGGALPSFDRMLRANTGLGPLDIPPIDVDFVRPPLEPAPEAPPWILLIVIDSLRADYLGAYNRAVSFTPRFTQFARESLVFRNAFARYGGTGLSMPSIWMGAAGPHKQYVEPFHPMNALEKLLDANRYRRYLSFDHISTQLLRLPSDTVQLDRGVEEMAFDTCGTLEELQRRLATAPRGAPIFAHTRSLNLHVASVRSDRMPDVPYPGFEPRYAARVHRIDACFGTFVDFLKRQGVYDRSVVIVMADHGELLGEDGRWGHAYYLFPEVLEIPLIVHLPPAVARRVTIDPDAAAFSTDLTPTLYAALGYEPHATSSLMGRSLIGPPGTDFEDRRRATEVVAASYGAVYGALTRNGHRLYIVDANHNAEFVYERQADGWRAVAVADAVRFDAQRAIREFVEQVAGEYHIEALP